jgi:hypothetical protein
MSRFLLVNVSKVENCFPLVTVANEVIETTTPIKVKVCTSGYLLNCLLGGLIIKEEGLIVLSLFCERGLSE